MKWNYDRLLPEPGSYRQKDAALEQLLLFGWHKEAIHNADGILPYVLESCPDLDPVLADHYRDFLSGHLRIPCCQADMPDVICRLYFCDSEEEIWDVAREGLADIDSFLFTYAGYTSEGSLDGTIHTASPERLERFCRFMEKDFPMVWEKYDFIMALSDVFDHDEFSLSKVKVVQ